MSRYAWDVPDEVAAIATVTLRVEIAVHFKISSAVDSLERTVSYDNTITLNKAAIPWADGGTLPISGSQDFAVIRFWPRRKPNATGDGDIPATAGLFIPYQRNVNCWPINSGQAFSTISVEDGQLNDPDNAPGILTIDGFPDGAPIFERRTQYEDFDHPENDYDTTEAISCLPRATLNRVDAGRLVNQFGWDVKFESFGSIMNTGAGPYPLPGITLPLGDGTKGSLVISGLCTIREASVGPAIHSVGIYTGEDGLGTHGSLLISDFGTVEETATGPATHSIGFYSQSGTPDLPASGSMVGSELQVLLPTDSGGNDTALDFSTFAANVGTWSSGALQAGTPDGAGIIDSPLATQPLTGGTDNTPNKPASGSMVGDELQIILPTDSDGIDTNLSGATVIANIAYWSGGLLTADTSTGSISTTMAETPLTGGTADTIAAPEFQVGDVLSDEYRARFPLTALTERKEVDVHSLLLHTGGGQNWGGSKEWTFDPPTESWLSDQTGFDTVDFWDASYKLTVVVA